MTGPECWHDVENIKRPYRHGYCNVQQSQSSNQNCLAFKDLWHWLADHSVPRKEIDVQFTKVLLGLYMHKSSGSNELKSSVKDKLLSPSSKTWASL